MIRKFSAAPYGMPRHQKCPPKNVAASQRDAQLPSPVTRCAPRRLSRARTDTSSHKRQRTQRRALRARPTPSPPQADTMSPPIDPTHEAQTPMRHVKSKCHKTATGPPAQRSMANVRQTYIDRGCIVDATNFSIPWSSKGAYWHAQRVVPARNEAQG